MKRRGFGWLPDLPRREDGRPDWSFADQATRRSGAPVPLAHSNRALVVDVLDQDVLGSCVACAGFQAIRMSHVRMGVQRPRLGARLMAYYLARAAHGMATHDSGTQLRTFFWVLNRFGFCFEDEYPHGYDISKFAVPPTPGTYRMAYDRKSPTRYWAIPETPSRITEIKRAVSLGLGVCFGIRVDDAFADGRIDPALPLDPPGAGITHGHAMVVEGYDGDAFTVLNSWGREFGNDGRCTLSADYLQNAHSVWVVEQIPK